MASHALEVPAPAPGRAWLILRSDSIHFNVPSPLVTAANAKGWKHRTRRADAAELENFLMSLGKSLSKELFGETDRRSYPLRELPLGYELYMRDRWHVSAELPSGELKPGKTSKTTKDDSLNRRTDKYVYGHPGRDQFRSADDMAPHIHWLADSSTSMGVPCACILCIDYHGGDGTAQHIQGQIANDPIKNNHRADQTAVNINAALAQRESLAQVTDQISEERLFDLNPDNEHALRPGEVAWFDRHGVGQEWGLGAVRERKKEERTYTIQPLSHPGAYLAECDVEEKHTRVFLSWSVPTTALPNPSTPYAEVDWALERQRRSAAGLPHTDCVVDSSILAALQVDASYSLFYKYNHEITTTANGRNTSQTYYQGIFLGTEKVWIGEPVRLRIKKDKTYDDTKTFVLVLRQIIEENQIPAAGTPPASPTLRLVGDVFELIRTSKPRAGKDWEGSHVPLRMARDVEWLNQSEKVSFSDWELFKRDYEAPLLDVAGRWYPTSVVASPLNSRMKQALVPGVIRYEGRKEALGTSVPGDFEISLGEDAHEPMDLDP